MSELVVVKPGQSIGDAVKQDIQQSAQAKQLVEIKKQVTQKLSVVINALMQTFAVDPDNASATTLAYSIGLAQGGGTSKEDFQVSVDKLWTLQLAQLEEVKDEQRKMMITGAKNLMAAKRPIPVPFLAQMQAIGCKIPDEVQAYIDAQAEAPTPPPAEATAKAAQVIEAAVSAVKSGVSVEEVIAAAKSAAGEAKN